MSIIIIHCHAFLKIKGLVIVRFCYMSFYLTSKEPGFHCWTMARSILNPVFLPRVDGWLLMSVIISRISMTQRDQCIHYTFI